MTMTLESVAWQDWRDRWERQQGSYIAQREERFSAMFDALEQLVGDEFTAVDLGCGPGAITRRLVARFPRARVLAIDLDPVLVAIGRNTLGSTDARVTWIEADLNSAGWVDRLGVPHVDAVLSTTAIHWLSTGAIADLYRTLVSVIRPGGVYMDGDQMRYEPSKPRLRRLSDTLREHHRAAARSTGSEAWDEWWQALRREPALAPLFEERDRRFAWRGDVDRNIGSQVANGPSVVHTGYALHRAALLEAGFAEVDTIWQHLDNRVLCAVR